VPALSYSEMLLHFENNSPFLTIRKLIKDYEISHWGNLAVEEHYEIEHTGAQLAKGNFFEIQLYAPKKSQCRQ